MACRRAARRKVMVLAPLVLLALPFTGRVAVATPAPASANWTTVSSEHVSGQYERLLAIAAPAPGDVWAFGYRLNFIGGSPEFRTLAEHYDGTGFVTVPTPDSETAPGRDFLNGAAAPAPNDVWAVGTTVGLGTPDRTLVERWDGTSWRIVASPNPGAVSSDLQAAAATSATDLWAVGARINTGQFYQSPMTLHWNGTAWRSVYAPNPSSCTGHSYLTAVTAMTPTAAWATGWCGSGGSNAARGYVLHWDGRTWSIATVIPQGVAPGSETYGIAARGRKNIWVVGSYLKGAARITTPLTYHFDGTSWTLVAGPSTALSLAAVSMGTPGVWSVGVGNSPQPPFAGPAAGQYRAPSWLDRPVPIPFGRLAAVTDAPDGVVWAVGTQTLSSGDDTALIVHR